MVVVFLARDRDILVMVVLFLLMILELVSVFSPTTHSNYSFLSNFPHMVPNIVTRVNDLETD